MKNIQKNNQTEKMKISEIHQIDKLFINLSDILQRYSFNEARYFVLVGQTSFQDAIILRQSINENFIDS